MKPLYVIILFFLQAFSVLSFSQTGNLKFCHLSTSDGLSQNSVFSILKDYRGFMWFATDEGLNKYDGYKFTVYKHDPGHKQSISSNAVSDIMEDADHNLWVVSAGGVDRFDRINETFIQYDCGNKAIVFRYIFQDSKKRFWLSTTNHGCCLFDPAKRSFKFYKNNEQDTNSLSQNYVYHIVEDRDGELWIGTRNGLNRFNPATEKFTRYYNEPGNGSSIGAGYIKNIFKDSKDNIWIGTQGSGISLYNRKDNCFINFKHDPLNKNSICYNDILSFTEDRNGQIWIGTENGGISVLEPRKKNFTSFQYDEFDPSSISGNSVHSLYKDDIGNIWAGTWSGGVNLLPVFGDKFNHYKKIPNKSNSLSNNLVLSISSDRDNNIWIGTDGGGLNHFDPASGSFRNYRNDKSKKKSIYNDYVLSVADYSPGLLALGFHRGGIDLFDKQTGLFTHYAPQDHSLNRLTSPSVNFVYKDRQDNLWLGTNDNGGIFLFDKKTTGFTNFPPDPGNDKSINGSRVNVMFETRAGQLWIGGDKGLDLFDRHTGEFIHHEHDASNRQSLSNNSVYCISEDTAGNIWVGTAGGLNHFDIKKNNFTAYTEKDGLPNNAIWGILQDHKGNLWISTNKGLSKFNPGTKIFRNYTSSDGLQSNTFKAKAAYQSPGGEMFFGGVNGFNSFYPDSIKDNNFVPPVYITDFLVFNKPVGIGGNSPLQQSVNEVKEITLSYGQSVFTLEFAVLNFTHPEQNRYAYKLAGFDEEWNFAGNKRSATYTNLYPGKYIFHVKGTNNDGLWNENGTSVIITILPPFWLTWWFILSVCMLILGIAFGFYRFRMNIIQRQKILLERKVKEQTVELVHSNKQESKARQEAEQAQAESETARQESYRTNEQLAIKNDELEQFAYVASHDLQEPLRMVTSFLTQLDKKYGNVMDDKGKQYIHFAVDGATRMRQIILDLLDFSRVGRTDDNREMVDLNELVKEIELLFSKQIEEKNAVIYAEQLPVINGYKVPLRQVFQNLVGNALKYARHNVNARIQITVTELKTHWQFTVVDNGIGIDKQYFGRIFIIFQRLHARDDYPGTGMGLAVTKKIVESLGGKIWVKSEEGAGSTFYFTINK